MKRLRRDSSAEETNTSDDVIRGDIQLLRDFYANREGKIVDSLPVSGNTVQRENVLDVIIVGAGWSGISAAMTLQSKGITNFRILEARDYVGGRSRTIYETFDGEDIPIDIGSTWIHGGKDNPIYEIATIVGGIPTAESKFTELVYLENNGGPLLPENQTKPYLDKLFVNGFMSYQEKIQESKNKDESLQCTVDRYIDTLSNNLEKEVAINCIKNDVELEYSAPLDQLSLKWWDDDSNVGGDPDLFLPEGYSPLIEAYAAPILDKIVTEAIVTKIDYRQSIIKCMYSKLGCDSEFALKSKKIIVTVPLGVLKAESIKFVPQLPRRTRRSIQGLGMGRMNKIFMFWNEVFWPPDIELFSDVVQRDFNFQFFNPILRGGKPMLFAFFTGSEVEDIIENRAYFEQKVTATAMVSLRNMFGSDIKDPEKVIVTNWNNDEFSFGTYSFNKVRSSGKKAREQLAVPIRRKGLFLAGEACSSKYFQTTHGAYLSGISSAEKVVKSLSKDTN